MFNASCHCSLPPQYIIQNKILHLASEYANLPFDYHNQLMYEEQYTCVAASQMIICVLLLRASIEQCLLCTIFIAEKGKLEKRPLAHCCTFKGQIAHIYGTLHNSFLSVGHRGQNVSVYIMKNVKE